MEYRKLISFGKSSFVVSIPKSWIVQNKLKKGDLIYFEENNLNLVLSKGNNKKEEESKTRVINIDGKDFPRITREVNSSYILNYRTIILKGNEIKEKIKELQQVFQNLIALEIMEQTSNSIIAKDFLNMDEVSIEELIRKMDIITRTMLKESCGNIFKDNYENINERDKDVNRLYFLLYRTVLYNLDNPSNAMKKFKLSPIDLFNYKSLAFYIEGIADESRRMARYSRHLKLNPKEKKELSRFLDKINSFYLETLKSVYSHDVESSFQLSAQKKILNKEIDSYTPSNIDVNYMNMVSRIRRLISFIHNLGRIAYTSEERVNIS